MSNRTRLKNKIDDLLDELDFCYSVLSRVNAHFGITKKERPKSQAYAIADWIDSKLLTEDGQDGVQPKPRSRNGSSCPRSTD